MMKKKRWHIMPRNVEKENTLIRELGVNPIVARFVVLMSTKAIVF